MRWCWVAVLCGLLLPPLAWCQEPSGGNGEYDRGQASFRKGNYASALAHYQQALAQRREAYGEQHPRVAIILNDIGLVYYKQGKYPKALEYFQKALAIWRKAYGKRNALVATALNNIGEVYREQSAYDKALDYYKQALAIRRELPNDKDADVAVTLNNIGLIYYHKAKYPKALDYYQDALDALRRLGGKHDMLVATTSSNIGAVYEAESEYEKSLEYYHKSLDIRRRLLGSEHPEIGVTLNHIGLVRDNLGEYGKALQLYRKALAILEKAYGKQHPTVARVLNNIGMVYLNQGDYDDALKTEEQALDIRRKVFGEEHPDVAESLNNIGLVYYYKGKYEEALKLYKHALAISRKVFGEEHPRVATVLNNIGVIYSQQGAYRAALDSFDKSLAMFRKLGGKDTPDDANVLDGICAVYERQGKYDDALKAGEQALGISRKVFGEQNPRVATALNDVGVIYRRKGEFAKAIDDYQQALAIRRKFYGEDHPDVAVSLLNVGYAYNLEHRYRRAEHAIEDALLALRQPRADGSLPREPFTPADLRPLPLTVRVLAARGMVQEKELGPTPTVAQLRACDQTYVLALGVLGHVRERVLESDKEKLDLGVKWYYLFPQRIGILGRLYEADHQVKHLEDAFTTAEQGTARVFLDELGRARAEVVGGVSPELRNQEDTLLKELRETDGRIVKEENKPLGKRNLKLASQLLEQRRKQEEQVEQLVAHMEKEYPRYAALEYPKPCTLEQARASLAPNEAALLFVPASPQSYVVVVEGRPAPADLSKGVAVYPLPDTDSLTDLVGSLTDTDTLALPARVRALAADAYQQLLGPLESRLRGKNLVIVPGGALCFLPFEMLVDADGHYLVEQHGIRYAPSLTVLYLIKEWEQTRPPTDVPLWAAGDPVYSPGDLRLHGEKKLSPTSLVSLRGYVSRSGRGSAGHLEFDRLLFSGVEVRDVRRILGAAPDEVRTGLEASEAAVKEASRKGTLAQARYLHFATHGILGLDVGQQPSLVLSLAGNTKEDGFLQLDEVTSLKLNADLVVLSACESGMGRLRNGEGVTGLARAFLYAGSRGVMCSLWSVNDLETARLMAQFYDAVKAGSTPARALRQAQLEMIRAGKPPLYWAPFILMGGSGRLG